MEDRLPSWLWVDALVRRVQVAGASCFIVQKGDRERGDVIIKVCTYHKFAINVCEIRI